MLEFFSSNRAVFNLEMLLTLSAIIFYGVVRVIREKK